MRHGDLTDEQRAIRLTGVGASEAAAIVGRSRYATPLDIYNNKRKTKPNSNTPFFQRGRILERAVLDWYEEEMETELIRQPDIGTLRHPEFPHVLATPDALDVHRVHRPVQAKTHRFDKLSEYGEEGTDAIPDEELIQVTMEMGVVGATVAHLPVLFGGDDFRLYKVEFRPRLFESIAERIEQFWRDHVEANKPPVMNPAQHARYLADTYRVRKTKKVRPATTKEALSIQMLADAQQGVDQALDIETRAKNAIREAIGDDYGIQAPGVGKVLWTGGEPNQSVDWKSYAASLEKLAGADERVKVLKGLCTTEGISERRLRAYWEDNDG